jgi:hypothetical protein
MPEGAPHPRLGRAFGPYEILEEISRGSFGVVYRARQPGLDRVVALKVLLAGAHASPEAISRFQREARAAARLRHPSIVPIFDIGSHEGHHYFAMGFVEGEPLSGRIARRDIGIPQALALAETLADAIQTAHAENVIHRDLKPSNIILDRQGAPHITDFGLAKQVDLDTRYTQSGTTIGTPAYMPPEQARGDLAQVGPRSDVYALGAVLYEMLTGRSPFTGRSLLEVVVAVLNEPVRPPRQINPNIHRDVQTIVLKCLEKDPALRYASAAELRDDIRRFRSGEAIHARPIGPVRRAGRLLRRHATFLAAAATVLLVVGLSAWQVWRMKTRMDQARARAEQDRREREERERLKELERSQPGWKPFWWWPERPGDPIPEEDRALFRQGLVTPERPAPDLVDGVQVLLPAERQLVSPEARRVFGDLEARLRFRLDGLALSRGVRIGIQSYEGGIPFLLDIRPFQLALTAPVDLYTTGTLERPPLRTKAQKHGPELAPGEYQLTFRRDGLNLRFSLQAPGAEQPTELAVWDVNLSYWKLKNIQLTIREPPEGFTLLAVELRRKTAPLRLDALSQALTYFHSGEYNGAEAELDAIVSKTGLTEDQDLLRVAQAYYFLGLIQEICHAQGQGDTRYYARALDTLTRCQPGHERRGLEALLRLRRLVRALQQGPASRAEDELARVADLKDELPAFAPPTPGIGEPYGWELAPFIPLLARSSNRAAQERALGLFRLLGLTPGAPELGQASCELARALAAEERGQDLLALNRAFPVPEQLPAFVTLLETLVVKQQWDAARDVLSYAARSFAEPSAHQRLQGPAAELMIWAVRGKRFDAARGTLDLLPRPALVRAIATALEEKPETPTKDELVELASLIQRARTVPGLDGERGTAISASLLRIALGLVDAGRCQEARALHEAWPDARLAPALAKAVAALAALNTQKAEDEALELLRYCSGQPAGRHPEVAQAAVFLARTRSASGDKDSYAVILKTQRAYPTPELLDVADPVLRKLQEARLYGEALSFYGSARVLFGSAAARLASRAIAVLEALPAQQASGALADLRQKVSQELAGQALEDSLWRMECGDLALALGLGERALAGFGELLADPRTPAEALARVTLRLCAWNSLRGAPLSPEIWAPVVNGPEYPEEARLLARYLTGAVLSEELDNELRRLGGASFFSDAEWDVARALHARAEGNERSAQGLFWEAARKAAPERAWPNSLFRQPPAEN